MLHNFFINLKEKRCWFFFKEYTCSPSSCLSGSAYRIVTGIWATDARSPDSWFDCRTKAIQADSEREQYCITPEKIFHLLLLLLESLSISLLHRKKCWIKFLPFHCWQSQLRWEGLMREEPTASEPMRAETEVDLFDWNSLWGEILGKLTLPAIAVHD